MSKTMYGVSADTTLLTKKGYIPVYKLEGMHIEVWNGARWSKVTPIKVLENQPIYEVHLSDGSCIECTDNQIWALQIPGGCLVKPTKTSDLYPKARLINFEYPILDCPSICSSEDAYDKGYAVDKNITAEVPKDDASIEYKLKWLSGFLDKYAWCISSETVSTHVDGKYKPFLMKVKQLVSTLGGISRVRKHMPSPKHIIYSYRLSISKRAMGKLYELGLKFHHKQPYEGHLGRKYNRCVQVISVEESPNKSDIYHAVEPIRGMLLCNGIILGGMK